MGKWSKQKAIEEIERLIKELKNLSGSLPYSTEHTRWLFSADAFLSQVFGRSSSFYLSFRKIQWTFTGQRIVSIHEVDEPEMGQERYDRHQFEKSIKFAEGIFLGAKDELNKHNIEDLYQGKNSSDEASSIIRIINLFEHKLRKIIRDIPNNERDIQNAVEDLLVASDIEHKREFPTITYSSKKYIPDFSFPKLSMALETKICNRKEKEKELIAEINDDIMAYSQEFSNLFFLIYDVGLIRDVDLFTSEFEKRDSVFIKVIKH